MNRREFDAYVYDLDGTLVALDVDWEEVRRNVAGVLRPRGVDVEGADLWTLLELADANGDRRLAEETISEFEREGARTADRLPAAAFLPHDRPVGVCSLNSEAACRIALESYGLDSAVEVIVGRDTLGTEKPDPEPLLAAVDALGTAPERTLFIGDSRRDYDTAERAGTEFVYASKWQELQS